MTPLVNSNTRILFKNLQSDALLPWNLKNVFYSDFCTVHFTT